MNKKTKYLGGSPYSLYVSLYQNTEIMLQSFYKNIKSCINNIKSVFIAEKYANSLHVQKYY